MLLFYGTFFHSGVQLKGAVNCAQMSPSSEHEIDLHIGHMLTYWIGHLASCQSHSDLRTSNILYANQI